MSFKNKFKSLFNVDDDYEYEYEYIEENVDDTAGMNKNEDNRNVVSLASVKQPNSKVVLCEPRSYGEAQEIADNLVNRRSVVINLERVDHHQAKRIVDFLSGTVYAISGDIQKLGAETFLCTPDNVEVSGTISNSYASEHEFEKGW